MAFDDTPDAPQDDAFAGDFPHTETLGVDPFVPAPLDPFEVDPPKRDDFPEDAFADIPEADALDLAVAPPTDAVPDDGRYDPVRLDRRVVLAGLLIAAAVVLLLLVLTSGGEDDRPASDAPRPTAATPEFIERGAEAPAYGDALPTEAPGASAQPYAADPYASSAYAADPYAADPYAGAPYAGTTDYAATRSVPASTAAPSYGPGASGSASFGRPPRDPEASAFERAVASPLVARSGGRPQPAARPSLPEGLSPEAEQEIYELQAIAAALTPPGSTAGPMATGPAPAAADPDRGTALVALPGPDPASASGPGAGSREAFRARTASLGPTAYGVRTEAPSARLVLSAGTVVPAALVTGLNSDLPGAVVAQVTRNVYDSRTQRDVIIPAGSRLIGEYDDQVAYGQDRALVAWTRLIFPDGRSVSLPGLAAHDLRGESGLRDRVNRHTGRLLGSAVLLAAVGAGVDIAAPSGGAFGGRIATQSPQETAARQVAIELSRVATEVLSRNLDVQPTVSVRPGFRFYVFLARDLAFASPYQERADVARFPRSPQPRR